MRKIPLILNGLVLISSITMEPKKVEALETIDSTPPLIVCKERISVEYGLYSSVQELLENEIIIYDEVDEYNCSIGQTCPFELSKIGEEQLLTFFVKDKSNNIKYGYTYVTILITQKPIIQCEDFLTFPKGEAIDLSTIISEKVAFYSPVNISNQCMLEIIEDTYSSNKNKEGIYQVTFKVTDSYENYQTKTMRIIVGQVSEVVYKDHVNQGPVLLSDAVTYIQYGKYTSVSDLIKDKIKAYDIEDESYVDVVQTGPIDLNLIEKEQTLQVGACDSENMWTYGSCKIVIYYDYPPEIIGNSYIISTKENPFYVSDLAKNYATYSKYICDQIELTSSIIYDDYTPSMYFDGVYKITLKVEDQFGNYSTKDFIIINQRSSVSEEKIEEESIIKNTCSCTLKRIKSNSVEDVIEYVEDNNIFDLNSYDKIEIINQNYEGNSNKNGDYYILLKLVRDDSTVEELTININVNTPNKNIFQKIGSFFSSLFKNIISIFKR